MRSMNRIRGRELMCFSFFFIRSSIFFWNGNDIFIKVKNYECMTRFEFHHRKQKWTYFYLWVAELFTTLSLFNCIFKQVLLNTKAPPTQKFSNFSFNRWLHKWMHSYTKTLKDSFKSFPIKSNTSKYYYKS